MDIFTKNKFTTILIVLLILINLVILSTIWFNRKEIFWPMRMERPPGNADRMVFFLKNELGLNEEQVHEYQQLRLKHHAQVRGIIDETHNLKKELMDQLFNDQLDSQKVNLLIDTIGEKQKLVEKIIFNHFIEIKNLCGAGQQEKLRRLLDEFFPPPLLQRPPGPENLPPQAPPPRRRRGN